MVIRSILLWAQASISKLISNAVTECVSAPTEMRSTPVTAIGRSVSKVTPPEASNSTTRPGRC
jgi:hypothetical protein